MPFTQYQTDLGRRFSHPLQAPWPAHIYWVSRAPLSWPGPHGWNTGVFDDAPVRTARPPAIHDLHGRRRRRRWAGPRLRAGTSRRRPWGRRPWGQTSFLVFLGKN
jgi:hypothetical protein